MVDFRIKNFTLPDNLNMCHPCSINEDGNGITTVRLYWTEKELKERLQKVIDALLSVNDEKNIKVLEKESLLYNSKTRKIPLSLFRKENSYGVK